MSAEQCGISLIQKWEKCKLVAYIPIPDDPWTIGWGATGPDIVEGTVWTQQQADADLVSRVAVIAAKIRTFVRANINDNQLGALIDFAYNEGVHAEQTSTLIRKFNAGDILGAANEFEKWDMSRGKMIPGLLNRRKDERQVFLS